MQREMVRLPLFFSFSHNGIQNIHVLFQNIYIYSYYFTIFLDAFIAQREAVSTSHCSQPNSLEYDMAIEWSLLQERLDCAWKKLYEVL